MTSYIRSTTSLPARQLAIGLLALIAASVTMITSPARVQAQDVMRIVAIVNDDIISLYDLQSRMRMVAATSQIKLKRDEFQKRILNDLIEEKLKLQEAERLNITVRDGEVERGLETLAGRNRASADDLKKFFRQNNIDIESLKTQLRSQLAWGKTVSRQLRRRVAIGEDEIDEELARLAEAQDQPQKRVFEIFLAMESPDRVSAVRQTAERIRQQLSEGANFAALARNFSQSNSASLGGDLGWVLPGQLRPDLDAVLKNMGKGSLSPLVESVSGIHILAVTEERSIQGDIGDTVLDITQLRLNTAAISEADLPARLQEITQQLASADSCEAIPALFEGQDGVTVNRSREIKLGDLAGPARAAVENLQPGQTAAPIALNNAQLILTVCARTEPKSNLPSRRDIGNRLRGQRMDLLARQYLRDLKNVAFIDSRI